MSELTAKRDVRRNGDLSPVVASGASKIEDYEYDADEGLLVRTIVRKDGSRTESMLLAPKGCQQPEDAQQSFDQAWLRSETTPVPVAVQGDVRIVDLFSGCGGMTLGVAEAGRGLGLRAVPLLALDSDRQALEVYDANFGPEYLDSRNIEEVLDGALGASPTRAESELIERLGRVDVLLAGPPCQGHSDLNNRTRRDDPKNALILKVARFVELFRPTHVIVENVVGILHDKTNVFDRTRSYLESDLCDLGYSVDAAKLQADRLGVAQHRHRIFLVASSSVTVSLEEMITPFVTPPRPFEWACGDLLDAANGGNPFESPSQIAAVTKRRIKYLFEKEIYDLPDSERPPCHRDKAHTYPAVYGRMRPREPAPTITTGFTSMGQGRFIHPSRRRTITPHEAARLQFFPDFFEFGDQNRTTLKRLIGNAVPPKLTYVLAVQLLR